MRIQHNIAALNSYRNLTNNNSAVSKNLEKLSSGYRINRAGDDAAGLAISEKMRAQITGLETAQKNANDGISLVQTAEGALTEVHSMLNRMVELATQSANGTYDDDVDRANLQKEVDSLMEEINRISEGTNFNGINLLDGTYGSAASKAQMSAANGIGLVNEGTTSTDPTEAGQKTILHKDGQAQTKAEFTIDFSTIQFDQDKIAAAGSTVTFTFGSTDVGVTVTKGMTQADLAQAVKDAVDGITGNTAVVDKDGNGFDGAIEVGNLAFKAEVDGEKVIFKQVDGIVLNDPANDDLIPDGEMFENKIDDPDEVLGGSYNTGSLNITPGVAKSDIVLANAEFELTTDMVQDGAQLTIGDETYTFRVGKDSFVDKNAKNVIDLSDFDGTETDFMAQAAAKLTAAAKDNAMFTVGSTVAGNNGSWVIGLQEKASYSGKADLTTVDGIKAQLSFKTVVNAPRGEAKSLTLQIGDTSDEFNKMKLNIDATDATSLGIGDINIGTQEGAAAAVDKIKAAINKVSSIRGGLGAIQNRLEHTINNLGVQTENITAAESRIRDVDMAKEMMAYTKNNILVQASQAMLAQANQVPQGVLQLLQ